MSDATALPPADAPLVAEVNDLLDRAWDVRFGDTQRALALCEKALEAAQALSYPSGVALSLYVRCNLFLRLSNPQQALKDALAALPCFEALGDGRRVENTLNMLGLISSELGDLNRALYYYLARYQLCEGRGDASEAEALQSLGYIHDYLGDHADALAYNLKSWQLRTASGNREGEAHLLNNIGYSYYRLGHFEEALEHYHKALSLGAAGRNEAGKNEAGKNEAAENEAGKNGAGENLRALVLDNMALALEKLGDFASALAYQQQSLDLREALCDKRGISYSLDSLGSIRRALGETNRARACLERSLALKKALRDLKGEAETLLLLGELYVGRPRQALPLLQEALLAATRSGSQDNVYGAHKALSAAFKRCGLLAQALEHHERYCEVKERVFNEASSRALGSLRIRFETGQAEKEREIYRLKNVELAQANSALQALNEQAAELAARLERQAKEDALTGLYNRRYADARLGEEFVRARRFDHALSVALCDVDDFKHINDTFSHAVGDEVLRTVARLLNQLREVDTAARYGGEEFVLLFPETAAPGAVAVCNDLRQKVAAHPWDAVAPGLAVTLSIGVSDDTSVCDCEKLVALADRKLYEAKRRGKNQVRA